MRRLASLLVLLFAPLAAAQVPTSRPGATVVGYVHDSIAGAPLAGAVVQLAAADGTSGFIRSATSDSLGRFQLHDVVAGRYHLGFFHSTLDVLGVAAPVRELVVEGHGTVRATLAIPAPPRLRAAICGSGADSGGVVVGTVRDPRDGTGIAGATVAARWIEFAFRPGGASRTTPERVATTSESGWFALCGVPRPGTLALVASRGADSTAVIEVEVTPAGFVRRELYVGQAHRVAGGDSAPPHPLLPADLSRIEYRGAGHLRGLVVAAEGGRPLAGARVALVGGPQTTANERGEWSLDAAPTGTRMLEVRAIGHYPERRAVDVLEQSPPVRVALATLRSVLDTVRVTASRIHLNGTGFEERRRSGMGRYVAPEEIERRRPVWTSDLFRMVAGVQVERSSVGETHITVRGAFGRCRPAVYIDGMHMRILSADDLDDWVRPDEIAGIEVYAGATAPPEFQAGMTGCGSIVVWTKPRYELARPWTLARALKAFGAVVLGVGIGSLIGGL